MDSDDVTAHFERLPHLLVPVDLSLWDSNADRFHAPYGYSTADLVCVGGANWRRIFRFCPELIAADLGQQDEITARRYLDSIVIHLQVHLAHIEESGDAFEEKIETVLETLDPQAYRQVLAVRSARSLR